MFRSCFSRHLRYQLELFLGSNRSPRDVCGFRMTVERLGAHMDWSKPDGFRAINPAAFGVEL